MPSPNHGTQLVVIGERAERVAGQAGNSGGTLAGHPMIHGREISRSKGGAHGSQLRRHVGHVSYNCLSKEFLRELKLNKYTLRPKQMDRLTMILSVFFMHLPRMHVFLLGKI